MLKNRIIRNFSNLVLGNAIFQILNLVVNIFIARELKPEDYGNFSFFLVQGQLYGMIASFGIKNILIRSVSRNINKSKVFFISSIAIQFIGALFSIVVLLIYVNFISGFPRLVVFFIILNIVLINTYETAESIFIAYERMLIPSLIKASSVLIWFLVVLLLIRKDILTYTSAFTTFSITLLINTVVIILLMIRKDMLKGSSYNFRNETILLFRNSLPYYSLILLTLPINYISNNFLEYNSSKLEVGLFNASNRLTRPLRLIISLGLLSFFPNISVLWSSNKEKFISKINAIMPYSIVMLFIATSFFSLFAEELVFLIYGAEYISSSTVFVFLIWFVCFFALTSLIGNFWGASDNQILIGRVSVIVAIIVTPLLWIGSFYGATGLSLAYFASYLITTPIVIVYFFKTFDLKKQLFNRAYVISLVILLIVLPASLYLSIFERITIAILLLLYVIYFFRCKLLLFINKYYRK